MAKARSAFFCSACGNESPRWLGRCPACQAWNSYADAPVTVATFSTAARASAAGTAPVRLADVPRAAVERISSGMPEFDALLGGGIVPGSLVLLGGPPGAGKSTLALQIAARLATAGETAVYVCGEESAAQTSMRARRLNAGGDLLLLPQTDVRAITASLQRVQPKLVVVDSIQTLALPDVDAAAGSVAQVRECATELMDFAKRTDCAMLIVGHVTKDGAIAGPRLLEHLVDTVLYFEGDSGAEHRIVRAHKNRFGSVDEICVFSMERDGLREVGNPSHLFLGRNGPAPRASGSCVVAGIVGSRPILIEVQALVAATSYGTPQRLAANLDRARLAMILAVLERRAGMMLGTHDVYASVAGGLRVSEPGADLGIALAVASAFRGVPLSAGTAVFGELGLSGEVRSVAARSRRAAEARRLGFTTVLAPPHARASGPGEPATTCVSDVQAAIDAVLA